jgi:hypothetical protein
MRTEVSACCYGATEGMEGGRARGGRGGGIRRGGAGEKDRRLSVMCTAIQGL